MVEAVVVGGLRDGLLHALVEGDVGGLGHPPGGQRQARPAALQIAQECGEGLLGASHPGVVGVAQVDGRLRAARDDVGQVRVDDQVADGGAQVAVLAGVDQLPQVDDDLCRGESGIGAQVGGRGAGVRGAAWMVISCQEMPWTPVTTPTGTSCSARTGPCSMWRST